MIELRQLQSRLMEKEQELEKLRNRQKEVTESCQKNEKKSVKLKIDLNFISEQPLQGNSHYDILYI